MSRVLFKLICLVVLAGHSAITTVLAGNAGVAFYSFTYSGSDPNSGTLAVGEYRNPILSGFYPDPSVCQVGKDYYLVNSTFAYFPGLPIFHSRDLVNWELIGHAVDRPDQLHYDGLGVSEAIFAPSITYHDGTFYLICTMVGSDGNFVLTAKNPAGPWSSAHKLEFYGIDPSLFFDEDGRAWIVNNDDPEGKPLYDGHRAIRLREFDLKTMKVLDGSKVLVNGGVDISTKPIWIEGPHLYKRDGWYFLCAAEGGTGPGHSQVVFRSQKVGGPYVPWEKNPILTQRNFDPGASNAVTCTGHAALVRGPDGRDWAVFLGVRPYERDFSPMGRETFLLPVEWPKGGWPMILPPNERVPLVGKSPNNVKVKPSLVMPGPTGEFTWRDDFKEATLSPLWIMLRTPNQQWWKLDAAAGRIEIEPRTELLSGKGNPSFLCRRVQHQNFTAETSLQVPKSAGVSAGLVAFQNDKYHYFMGVRTAVGAAQVFLEQVKGGERKELAVAPIGELAKIKLRVVANGPKCSFAYAAENGEWKMLVDDADAKMLTTAVASGFVGATVGMYACYTPPAKQGAQRGWQSDNGDGTFNNPPLYADYPDPDVIRVGDNFYFITTTFANVPGLRILHSKDLVNWEIISHILPRLTGVKAYDMEDGVGYRDGVFAPSMRFHKGKFYVAVTPNGYGQHTVIYNATDVRGPWTAHELDRAAFDPGLFIDDDGKGYIMSSGGWDGTATLLTLNEDYTKVVAEKKVYYQRGAEGAKLVKRGGWYYLFNSLPGRLALTVSRARSLEGPWETHSQIDDRTGGHQGAIVDLADGSDFGFVMIDDRFAGRMTQFSPVFWEDGWPVWGTKDAPGRVPRMAQKPIQGQQVKQPATSDDFASTELGLQWAWNHNPDNARWSLTERPGYLRLKPTKASEFWLARNTLTQKGQGPRSSGVVKLDLSHLQPGDVCGFGTLGKFNGHIAVSCAAGGKLFIGMNLIEDNAEAGRKTEVQAAPQPLDVEEIFLRTNLDFKNGKAACAYSLDGKTWTALGSEFNCVFDWRTGTFQGPQFAIFCYSPNPGSGFVDVDEFRFNDQIESYLSRR